MHCGRRLLPHSDWAVNCAWEATAAAADSSSGAAAAAAAAAAAILRRVGGEVEGREIALVIVHMPKHCQVNTIAMKQLFNWEAAAAAIAAAGWVQGAASRGVVVRADGGDAQPGCLVLCWFAGWVRESGWGWWRRGSVQRRQTLAPYIHEGGRAHSWVQRWPATDQSTPVSPHQMAACKCMPNPTPRTCVAAPSVRLHTVHGAVAGHEDPRRLCTFRIGGLRWQGAAGAGLRLGEVLPADVSRMAACLCALESRVVVQSADRSGM